MDERIDEKEFTCICLEGYSGNRCQIIDIYVTILFSKEIFRPLSVLAHFITIRNRSQPERMTTFQRIAFDDDSLRLYTSIKFHLLFIEFFDHLYLTVVQQHHNPSVNISTSVMFKDRCRSIRELFNETVQVLHILRREKHYQIVW